MWKSESALLIYLAAVVSTTVAARPVVAHHLAARQPGIPGGSCRAVDRKA
jgi:hypothetical protein